MNLVELAETAPAYERLKPGEDLRVTERYILFMGHDRAANIVQRLRLPAAGLPDAVEMIRRLVRAHGGCRLTWEVSNLAEPTRLAERLVELGARPAEAPGEPTATLMAAAEAPAPGPRDVTVARVASAADFKTYVTITHEVFGIQERLPAELERVEREGEADLADTRCVRYIAWIEGEPVGAASATFGDGGAILSSGCTRERARGRGAYRALVAARWEDALARGTPRLVAKAGAMSAPILHRLGFERIGELRILRDDFDRV